MAAHALDVYKRVYAEYESNALLAECSHMAQSNLLRLQCLMARTDRYGHLILNGQLMTAEQIAFHARLGVAEVTAGIAELEAAALLQRTNAGVLYCPMMTAQMNGSRTRARKVAAKREANPESLFDPQAADMAEKSEQMNGSRTRARKVAAKREANPESLFDPQAADMAEKSEQMNGSRTRARKVAAKREANPESLFDPQAADMAEKSENSERKPLNSDSDSDSNSKKDPLCERGREPAPAAPATPPPAEPGVDLLGDQPAPQPSRPPKPSAAEQAAKLQKAVDGWNAFAARHGKPLVLRLTAPRKARLNRRLHELGGLDGWMALLGKAGASPWLLGLVLGRDGTPFRLTFDYLLRESAVVKIMEGNYDLHETPSHGASRTRDPRGRYGYLDDWNAVCDAINAADPSHPAFRGAVASGSAAYGAMDAP